LDGVAEDRNTVNQTWDPDVLENVEHALQEYAEMRPS